jgi:DNA gyrase/topoisomerase IV subunit B
MNPGVYIGAVDSDGYWLVVRECLDNGLDEFLAGRNTGVALVEADDGSYYVYDQGFGIPQGTKTFEINVNGQTITSKMPVMQAVFSELHTSGKYRSDAYKTSVGCFVGETKIKLLDGTEPTFEELYNRWQKDQSPILVYTWDVEKDQAAFSNISHVQLTKYTDELVDVTLDSGKTIRCTPNHPFYVRTIRGIKKVHAEKLTPDMSLVSMRVDTDESGYMSGHDLTRNGFSKECALHTEESYEQSRACCHPNWLRGVEAIKRANGCKTIEEVKSFVDNYNHRIVSVKRVKLDKPVPVYDLTVDGTHTYFVDEALVSNSHGMGVKATNALSEFFTATTCYKGRWYTIGFEHGVLTQPLKQTTAPKFQGKTLKKGTLIHLKHDNKIFKNDKRLDFERAKSWAEITTYLNPGFAVVIKDKDGNTFKYKSQDGAKEFVQKILTDLKAQAEPEVFEFKNELADVVVSFSSAEGCNVRGYTNGLFNSDGGKHVDSVVNALFSACKPFAKAKQTLSLYDFKEGLVGIVNMHLHKAEFSSQDKLKLTDNRAGAEFQSVLEKHTSAFFKKNKVLAQKLCERASKLSELRNQFKASKKMITALNAAKKKGMPAKYAPFDSRSKLEDRELLIVEGDSAAGGLREVRYSYQSLMPLRGKIANCFHQDTEILLADNSVKKIADINSDFYGYEYDFATNSKKPSLMSKPFKTKQVTSLLELTFDDGFSVKVTHDHLFLTDHGWIKAKDLTEDDEILAL